MKKVLCLIGIFQITLFGYNHAQSLTWTNDTYLTIQEGIASYYGKRFHKRKTASGEIFDMNRFTAAHKHLPFGTLLKVTNLENGYEVIVKINDRLPKSSKRVIDLSRMAADRIDMIRSGIAEVKIEALNTQTIAYLREYFEEVPEDLRLRLHYAPIYLVKNGEDLFQVNFNPKN